MNKKDTIIIGLAGRKRSGKTTAADVIRTISTQQGLNPIRLGLADPIKAETAKIFGYIHEDHKETIRPVYQAVGETAKKLYGDDYWLRKWKEAQHHYQKHGYNVFIVDDVRFPAEANILKGMGATIWRIKNSQKDSVEDNHPSETNVDKVEHDRVIENEKNLETFVDMVKKLWEEYC